MSKAKTLQKFKAVEKTTDHLEWEGQEIGAVSDTHLEFDTGTGQAIVLRFFDFGANPEAFKDHVPSAQELFDSHRKGIEALLWRDGLKPYEAIQPRFMISKNKEYYRFIIGCIPILGKVLSDTPRTLKDLIKK